MTLLLEEKGIQGSLKVGTTPVEIKVGESKLIKRRSVTAFNNSNVIIYWGYNKNLTVDVGTPIYPTQFYGWDASDQFNIFLIAATTNNDVRITEAV